MFLQQTQRDRGECDYLFWTEKSSHMYILRMWLLTGHRCSTKSRLISMTNSGINMVNVCLHNATLLWSKHTLPSQSHKPFRRAKLVAKITFEAITSRAWCMVGAITQKWLLTNWNLTAVQWNESSSYTELSYDSLCQRSDHYKKMGEDVNYCVVAS